MKKSILVIVIILLVGFTAWYLTSSEGEVVPPVSTISGDKQAVAIETKQKSQIKKLMDLAKEAPDKLKELMMSNPKMAAMDAMGKAMNADFQFYGKIVDQHGDAVPHVSIKYDIGGFGSFGQPFARNFDTITNDNGEFSLSGNGDGFSILSMSKNGYEFTRGDSYYTYPRYEGMKLKYKGSPEKPVIIHAWKKVEAEPLYHGEIFQGFLQDGQYYYVDIPALNKTMKVAFVIDPEGDRYNPLDWSVNLKVERGGVIESNDVFMNEAPEADYQTMWVSEHKKSDPNFGKWGGKRKFYVKGLNGKVYGRIEVKFAAYYGNRDITHGVIDAKYWINPSSSRNLQYDRSKRIQ